MSKWVYKFGGGTADGRAEMKNLLGGKGANLAEMCAIGLPVPPGFTATTEVCTYYYANGRKYPDDFRDQIIEAVRWLEGLEGKTFGDPGDPLLLSVRSGARASMPGMMDTVLNLGLNDDTVQGLATRSGDRRFAFDSYRRFIQMYSSVVLGIDLHHFEDALDDAKSERGFTLDTEMRAEDWEAVVQMYKQIVFEKLGSAFPSEPWDQLWGGVGAVFGSWMNQRAITYRRLHGIPEAWGTAVNVQVMVFGNMGEDCATGVAFTRDPSTGDNNFYGEYLVNAQGEDVVAGIRTPQPINKIAATKSGVDLQTMEELMPALYNELHDYRLKLENHYRDMQDMEFTIQSNKLYVLQTRNGKRTAPSALKIAVDLCNEGLIDKSEAVNRVEPASLDQLLHPTLDPKAPRDVIGRGLPASPGAASGKIVMTADEAEALTDKGEIVILVREETSPEDIHGMHAAVGILTTRGGMTSHAAVVARGMGRPCVSGAGDLHIDFEAGTISSGSVVMKVGDIITLDGSKGEVMKGEVPTIKPELSGDFAELMGWADELRRMRVRTNAETPVDAETARGFGAEGIGLCRTEHMFFDSERITTVRQMIVADTEAERRAALAKLLPVQREDFVSLFKIMAGYPVTVRLLDPPLHEFLPKTDADMEVVAKAAGVDAPKVRQRAAMLAESNPMLGHRGCRLGITFPEIYEMQARAIFEAAAKVQKDDGQTVVPEVMIPLAFSKQELDILKAIIDRVAQEVINESGVKFEYMVGTMIELPRAALRAGDLAESAEFFSFGTNDLTQTTFGISRDDAAHFLPAYIHQHVVEDDPFATLDQSGVGELMQIAADRGRETRPKIKLGICGEHGGDPASVRFCESVHLDYVSCSPFRVPIAKLAAAQAALQEREPDS